VIPKIRPRTACVAILIASAAVVAAPAAPPPSTRPTTTPATVPATLPSVPGLPPIPDLPPLPRGLADDNKEKPPPYPAPGELEAVEKLRKRGCIVERTPLGGDYGFIFWGKDRDITDDDLALFQFIPGATHIDLSGSKKVTDAGIRHLRGLRFLRTLYLRRTAVTDASLLYTGVTEKAAKQFEKENPKIRTSY